MVAQTLILAKTKFKTKAQATAWVRQRGFKVRHKRKGPDETATSFRFRQRDPGDFVSSSFKTIKLTGGVSMVVGRLKVKKDAGSLRGVDTNYPSQDEGSDDIAADLLDLLA